MTLDVAFSFSTATIYRRTFRYLKRSRFCFYMLVERMVEGGVYGDFLPDL